MDYKWEAETYFKEIINIGVSQTKEERSISGFDACFKMSLLEELRHLNETLSEIKRRMFK